MENRKNATFMSVAEFKQAVGHPTAKLGVIKNPNNGKLFMNIGGKNYKVQQNFDGALDHCVIVPEGVLEEACLINAKQQNNTLWEL